MHRKSVINNIKQQLIILCLLYWFTFSFFINYISRPQSKSLKLNHNFLPRGWCSKLCVSSINFSRIKSYTDWLIGCGSSKRIIFQLIGRFWWILSLLVYPWQELSLSLYPIPYPLGYAVFLSLHIFTKLFFGFVVQTFWSLFILWFIPSSIFWLKSSELFMQTRNMRHSKSDSCTVCCR